MAGQFIKTAGIDFAQIVKTYGVPTDTEGQRRGQRRYRPMECTGVQKFRVTGSPDMDLVSTSYVERSNLSLDMSSQPNLTFLAVISGIPASALGGAFPR